MVYANARFNKLVVKMRTQETYIAVITANEIQFIPFYRLEMIFKRDWGLIHMKIDIINIFSICKRNYFSMYIKIYFPILRVNLFHLYLVLFKLQFAFRPIVYLIRNLSLHSGNHLSGCFYRLT